MKRVFLILGQLSLALFISSFVGCALTPSLDLAEGEKRRQKANLLLAQASEFMVKGDKESLKLATGALDLARDLSGDEAELLDAQGCVEIRRESYEFAEQYFLRAIAADPEFSGAYSNLAWLRERAGRLSEAKQLFETALLLEPGNIQARNNYAVLLDRMGQSFQARGELYKLSGGSKKSLPASSYNLEQFERTFRLLIKTKDLD